MRRPVESLALIAVFVMTAAGCSSGSSSSPTPVPQATPVSQATPTPTPSPASSGTVTITIGGNAGAMSFSPADVSVKAGQAVVWRNADSITHTATQNGGGFNTGNIAPGATSSPITVSATGSFGYHCAIHPGMVGTLTVTN